MLNGKLFFRELKVILIPSSLYILLETTLQHMHYSYLLTISPTILLSIPDFWKGTLKKKKNQKPPPNLLAFRHDQILPQVLLINSTVECPEQVCTLFTLQTGRFKWSEPCHSFIVSNLTSRLQFLHWFRLPACLPSDHLCSTLFSESM